MWPRPVTQSRGRSVRSGPRADFAPRNFDDSTFHSRAAQSCEGCRGGVRGTEGEREEERSARGNRSTVHAATCLCGNKWRGGSAARGPHGGLLRVRNLSVKTTIATMELPPRAERSA